MTRKRVRISASVLFGLCLAASNSLLAQNLGSRDVVAALGATASRAQLESLAREAELLSRTDTLSGGTRAAYRRQAALVTERLQEGDFQVGDQIVLDVRGDSALRGTYSVQPGRELKLPDLPALPLRGVLRAEITTFLSGALARYLRDPQVTATPLLRVAILGEVRSPGFYRVPAQTPLSDLVMLAGGPTPDANLASARVVRGDAEFASASDISHALTLGATLDQLSMRAGDALVIGRVRRLNVSAILQPLAILSGAAVAILTLSGRRRW